MLQLDLGTIIAVMSGIQLLFAVLFALISLDGGTARGARQWAISSLCLAASFAGVALIARPMPPLLVGMLAVLAGAGVGTLYNGIEAFNGKRCHYAIPAGLVLLFVAQNFGLGMLYPQESWRLAANSAVIGAVYALCARAVLRPQEQSRRMAYGLAAGAFSLFAVLGLARAVALVFTPPGDIHAFLQTEVHPVAFLFGSLAQMATSLSLALLITYRLSDDLRRLASIDALTGLLNRRSFVHEAERMLARAERTGEPLSVLMVDVDFFKDVNDRHGHLAGDEVLRRLAALMQQLARGGDVLARYGGEEFCILLPTASEAQGARVAERLRQRYAAMDVAWKGQLLRGTVSIGIADAASAGLHLDALIGAADESLYRAKAAGRNCVARHSELLVCPPEAHGI